MIENQTYSLKELTLYFLKLGTIGFGGPVALVGYMYKDLVENRKWISEEEYKQGLALAQLAPGPLAAQLGIYLGFVHYRILGATLVGFAFVLPSYNGCTAGCCLSAIWRTFLDSGRVLWSRRRCYRDYSIELL